MYVCVGSMPHMLCIVEDINDYIIVIFEANKKKKKDLINFFTCGCTEFIIHRIKGNQKVHKKKITHSNNQK